MPLRLCRREAEEVSVGLDFCRQAQFSGVILHVCVCVCVCVCVQLYSYLCENQFEF